MLCNLKDLMTCMDYSPIFCFSTVDPQYSQPRYLWVSIFAEFF